MPSPAPSLYEQFKDKKETDFHRDFVRPFLNRMGFAWVEYTHGPEERGQEFVVSESHRIFGTRTYAVVVKHWKNINSGARVTEVLGQIKAAFNKRIQRPNVRGDTHVSLVMVMNSGGITAQAQQSIWESLGREHYGDNVIFMPGDILQALHTYAGAEDERRKRDRIQALLVQSDRNIAINITVRGSILKEKKRFIATFIHAAIEDVLTDLKIRKELGGIDCTEIHQTMRQLEVMTDRMIGPIAEDAYIFFRGHVDSLSDRLDDLLTQLRARCISLLMNEAE